MPIEFNPLWKLSNPVWAFAFGISLIAIIAVSAYWPARKMQGSVRIRYMRTLALVSELLVSVGIIGLITFAARIMIDAEIRQKETTAQELQRQVNVAVWDFAKTRCLVPSMPTSSAQAEAITISAACALWPKLITAPGEFVDWWTARDQFTQIAKIESISAELSLAYSTIANRIDSLIFVQNEHALDKHKKKLLESEVSWGFVAISVMLAAIGSALKWARAAIDLMRANPAVQGALRNKAAPCP